MESIPVAFLTTSDVTRYCPQTYKSIYVVLKAGDENSLSKTKVFLSHNQSLASMEYSPDSASSDTSQDEILTCLGQYNTPWAVGRPLCLCNALTSPGVGQLPHTTTGSYAR